VKIRTVEFAGAVASPKAEGPGDLPQVAFAGRSNVGKSSLINRLLGRTRTPVARVSGTPGKTREVNFYLVDALREDGGAAPPGRDASIRFYLVDLPGYGYARVPLEVRGSWKPLMEGYLSGAETLRGVVQLVDARHGPTQDDLRMLEFLATLAVPTLVVLTKVDKLKPAERSKQVAAIGDRLGLDPEQVVSFSSKTGDGREALLGSLEALLTEVEP
jgi:GTP-binding protein